MCLNAVSQSHLLLTDDKSSNAEVWSYVTWKNTFLIQISSCPPSLFNTPQTLSQFISFHNILKTGCMDKSEIMWQTWELILMVTNMNVTFSIFPVILHLVDLFISSQSAWIAVQSAFSFNTRTRRSVLLSVLAEKLHGPWDNEGNGRRSRKLLLDVNVFSCVYRLMWNRHLTRQRWDLADLA